MIRVTRYLMIGMTMLMMGAAQEAAPQKSKGATFSIMPLEKLGGDTLYYLYGREMTALEFRYKKRSVNLPVRLGAPLKLYVKDASSESKFPYKLVAQSGDITNRRTLVFIKKSKQGAELPYAMQTMDDDLARFPQGSFRYINMTKVPLVVECGGVKSSIGAYSDTVARPKIPESAGSMPIIIRTKDGMQVLGGQTYGIPTDRKMIIIRPNEKKKSPISLLNISQPVHEGMF